MAGVLGFEPRMTESESVALPLGDTPRSDAVFNREALCSQEKMLVFFEIFIPGIDISAQPLFDQRENVSRLGCDLENPRGGFGQKLAVSFDPGLDKINFSFLFNYFG